MIEIKPDCSLTWNEAKIIVGVVCSVILLISVYFASKGAWLVLPFSGAEIIMVISGFYLGFKNLQHRELIQIEENEIRIFQGLDKLMQVASFNPFWAKIKHSRDSNGWYQDRLYLHSHGKYVEVARGLTNEEKRKLSEKLQNILKYK